MSILTFDMCRMTEILIVIYLIKLIEIKQIKRQIICNNQLQNIISIFQHMQTNTHHINKLIICLKLKTYIID